MRPVPAGKGLKPFFVSLSAVLAGSVLFAAAFPSLPAKEGLPLLAWIAYVPVFFVIGRSGFRASVFWGALYGYSAYGLFNYWLSVFHPLAGLIVGSIYLVYLACLFPLLRLALFLFPRRGYILQWLIWMGFEYLRTRGFLGYAYGITGYSQWNLIPVIQIADITGVWGVSALVVFPSAWIAAAIGEGAKQKAGFAASLRGFFRREWLSAALWAAALAVSLIYGLGSQIDYSASPQAKMALIQHNTDPWKGGIVQYRENYRVLKRLSDEAVRDNPDLDLVVWSETAFVPRIYWHQHYRDDMPSWNLVGELLEYLAGQDVAFLIGNDDARKEAGGNRVFIVRGENYSDCVTQIRDRFGDSFNVVGQRDIRIGFRKGLELSFKMDVYRVDYNAAMLFDRGILRQLYRKLHLVPFTEHFPYEKQLPWVYDALINADTHFWKKGDVPEVFEHRGIKFSTPICFEDTFGYLSRDFVRNGAEIIVNLSNDAWSQSLPAQMQHLSMAVFRAVENRRSMARSTASGQTCSIDPNGRILAMAEPFTEAALAVTVPIVGSVSFYTRFGDWLPLVFIAAALALLIAGIVFRIIKLCVPVQPKTGVNAPGNKKSSAKPAAIE
ncbi:MAG: apolipoprotein N-acyltransferase [Treponema sp.]|jgi:apolipoprotein N-acyltransferase|nr:apolipoprotein N-acyltransferase [Treponema sp.]